MIINLRKLRGKEIRTFEQMLKKYKGYDVVDLLIHKTLKSLNIPFEEIESRELKS